MRCTLVCRLLLLAISPLYAQDAPFRTTVPVVTTPAVVTDHKGNPVAGQFEKDFVLWDNGRERSIRVDTEYRPLSLVVLVQTNKVSVPLIRTLRQASGLFSELLLGPEGELALVTYERDIQTPLPFTTDYNAIRNSLGVLTAHDREPSRLLDGVDEAMRLLRTRPAARRRVILTIGEPFDRGSTARWQEVAERLQQLGVVLYQVSFSAKKAAYLSRPAVMPPPSNKQRGKYDPVPELEPEPITGPPPGPPSLTPPSQQGVPLDLPALAREIGRLGHTSDGERLARLSGGRTPSNFVGRKGLETAIDRISTDLHDQYWLSFAPNREEAAGFHTLRVEIRGRPELKVVARSGYWLDTSHANPAPR